MNLLQGGLCVLGHGAAQGRIISVLLIHRYLVRLHRHTVCMYVCVYMYVCTVYACMNE